ncbi:hypothetical protein AGMMS49940_06830 [Spirochaetia bacterium]|nr:hypothetical protein AGMMS49940_06830 [Spirochaetia bacterium]
MFFDYAYPEKELRDFKNVAKMYFELADDRIKALVKEGRLKEITP